MQTTAISGSAPIDHESDEGENDELIDDSGALGDGFDSSDGEEDDGTLESSWILSPMGDIPVLETRSCARLSSASTAEPVATCSYMPEFKGYNGRREFNGINKNFIDDNRCFSVLSFFQLFITGAILEAFVTATNYWGRNYFTRYWRKDLDVAEFKAFLAIIFEMGIVKYPNRDVAFENTDHGNAFARSLMSKNRFDKILRCWRFEDYSQTTAATRNELRVASPFWAAKAFIVLVATAFELLFNPGQLLDIDEQCIPWKGRHRCRCYNPNKPEKWHFKVFALNDAETGYMCNFYLYEGKAEERDIDTAATMQPLKKLFCDNPKYFGRFHVMITDNWYTNERNFIAITDTDNEYMGTIKTNSKGMPNEGKFPKTGRAKKTRGEFQQMEKTMPNGKKAYFIAWQDNKPVHILSSFPSFKSSCRRVVRNPDGSWNPNAVIPQPTVIKVYNTGMGGTDSFDQRMSYYRPKVKSTKSWYPRVFVHVINAAAINAFLIYNLYHKKPASYTYLDFARSLITELAQDELEKKSTTILLAPEIAEPLKRVKAWVEDKSRLQGYHMSLVIRQERVVVNRSLPRGFQKVNYIRGCCMVCGRKIPSQCKQCHIFLCNEAYGSDNLTCFEKFHTLPDFR